MIDIHCHILPGIDDGPQTLDGAVELIRASAATGMQTLVATSHVSPRYRNDARVIAAALADVRAGLLAAGLEVDVRQGAEIAVPRMPDLAPGELERLTLDGGEWLLIESPFKTPVDDLPAVFANLRRSGHRILLAHPERCPEFHRRPDMLRALLADGHALGSLTAGSLVGQFGRDVQRFSLWMAENGLVHNVASDAHDCVRRPPGIAEAMLEAGLGAHVDLLAHDVPAAILTGRPLPHIPSCLAPYRPDRRLIRRSPPAA